MKTERAPQGMERRRSSAEGAPRGNIVITGFMGTGKTTVGRSVAAALAMEFVDMDDVIAARAGMPVADIFAVRGETAFREFESALAAELGAATGLVIATGGGAMLRPQNRAALSANGLVVCLSCATDEIIRRLEGDRTRPLLEQGDRRQRIETLLAARAVVYDSLEFKIDVTRLTVAEVTAIVVNRYRQEQCTDSTST